MKDTTQELEQGKLFPLILKLTFPAVIAQLITFLYNVVDRIYVSNIQGIKTEALAALGIVLPITILVQAFSNLIGLGGSPRATIALGEGKKEESNRIFNTSFLLLVLFGIVLSFLLFFYGKDLIILFGCPDASLSYASDYLRIYSLGTLFILLSQGLNPFITAQGRSFSAMFSILIGALINIALDPLFIFVFRMGVKGASLATILSQAISFIWIFTFFFRKSSIFRIRLKDMAFSLRRCLSIFSLGLSPFIMTATECAIQIVFNICLKKVTGSDEAYTAALTIMLSALQLISLPLNGMGYGMQPFVSYNYGKGNIKRLKKGIFLITGIAFVFAVMIYTISMIYPGMYATIFSADPKVRQIVIAYCPLFLMGTIMFFIQMTLQNINVALGQALSALCLACMRKVVILIPLCFLLSHYLGAEGVFLSEGIADSLAGIITGIVLFLSFRSLFKQREKPSVALTKGLSGKGM